jgi:hypothetical protein
MTSPLEVSKFHMPYLELTQPIDYIVNMFSQLWIYIFILVIACVLYFSKPKKSSLMKGG